MKTTPLFAFIALVITTTLINSSYCQDPEWKRPGTDEAAAVEQANNQIDEVYKSLMSKLDDDGKKSLREAQRSWVKWRDEEAVLITRVNGSIGGSALRVDYFIAQAQLIRGRTEVLKEYLKWSGGKDLTDKPAKARLGMTITNLWITEFSNGRHFVAEFQNTALQQNLWVNLGSGRSPSV